MNYMTIYKIYCVWVVCVLLGLLLCVLKLSGCFDQNEKLISVAKYGVHETTLEEIIDSVEDHSIDFEKRHIQLEAVVSHRTSYDTVMITSPKDKVWWYIETFEESDGHQTKYGYKPGKSYKFKLYIRDINYRDYENNGEGRYFIWSEVVK